MTPHLGEWLGAGAITIAIGALSVVVHAHATGTALLTVGVRLDRTTVRAIGKVALVALVLGVIVILGLWVFQPTSNAARPYRTYAAGRQDRVVDAYLTAISDHNWQRVWQLGGKNLGTGIYRTYPGMISGYRCTIRDELIGNPTTNGEAVSGSFLAYEANGNARAVQRYVFKYVVRGGVIVSAHVSLVSGSSPPGC